MKLSGGEGNGTIVVDALDLIEVEAEVLNPQFVEDLGESTQIDLQEVELVEEV